MTTETKTEPDLKEESWDAGDIEAIEGSYEVLTPEDDKRILRKLDMWYVHCRNMISLSMRC